MAAISTLVPDVRVEIPGVAAFVAERQLLRATRVFCEETRAWRTNISVGVSAATPTVILTSLLPTATEMVDVISVKNSVDGGEPVHPRTYAWLDQNRTNWRAETNNYATYFLLDGNDTIRFVPTPSDTIANLYDVRVAVKPLLTATTIDDILANKFREELIHGALGYLYAIPKKPWSDPGLATFHINAFNSGIPAARTAAAEEFQTGVPRKVKYGGL